MIGVIFINGMTSPVYTFVTLVCKVSQMLYMVLTFKYVDEISYVTIQMKPLQQYFNMVL